MTTLAAWTLIAKIHGYDIRYDIRRHNDDGTTFAYDSNSHNSMLWGWWRNDADHCLYQRGPEPRGIPRGIYNSPQYPVTLYPDNSQVPG